MTNTEKPAPSADHERVEPTVESNKGGAGACSGNVFVIFTEQTGFTKPTTFKNAETGAVSIWIRSNNGLSLSLTISDAEWLVSSLIPAIDSAKKLVEG